MIYAWVNGARVNAETACVPIDDRGFRFGDGLFDTIPIHDGLPYLWEYHMERLEDGLKALCMQCRVKDLLPQALALISSNEVVHGLLRMQVSRGTGSQGYLPLSSNTATIVMQTMESPIPPAQPVTLWLSSYRKISPNALPVQYKLAQGLGSTLARMEAAGNGCFEALQITDDNHISEASSANIFWRSEGRLYTPSLACGALAGVTRRRIRELSAYAVEEGQYTLSDMAAADAVILTNASLGAIAVQQLSGQKKTWGSMALAAEINALRASDIRRHTHRLRKSLART